MNIQINPRKDREKVNSYVSKELTCQISLYPQFFMGIKFTNFRNIDSLELTFKNPITVITGGNRCGKTTTLMAIACSHYNFKRRDVCNGTMGRAKWGDLMRFTHHDHQTSDWTYYVNYRIGSKVTNDKRGQHRTSGKWNGVAKKEGQIGTPGNSRNVGRAVYFIEVDRIMSGRHLSRTQYNKARQISLSNPAHKEELDAYLSYIFECTYNCSSICQLGDRSIFGFSERACYTSFNTASGEDVLISLLSDIVAAETKSLILIDEIEIGLHPKLQRRLMDVLYHISSEQQKQFIITTHSYAVLDSVAESSRIYINNNNGRFSAIQGVTTEEALTRMDSERFPIVSVYVEDEVSLAIVESAIAAINVKHSGISRLISRVCMGSADRAYTYFKLRSETAGTDKLARKAACILDGDMKGKRDSSGNLSFPPEESLFFHHSNVAPEKMLVEAYLAAQPNSRLQYHLTHSNPHILLQKMVEEGLATSKKNALQTCIDAYVSSPDGGRHFEQLKQFLLSQCTLNPD